MADRPIAAFLALLLTANIIFSLWFLWVQHGSKLSAKVKKASAEHALFSWKTAAIIFVIGLIARVILIPSLPILEDDFYRYMWDGAVVSEGLNPYAYAPDKMAISPDVAQLLEQLEVKADPVPADYTLLAQQGQSTLLRVNNPNVSTIYPPLAQLGFAAASLISPFDILGLKIIVLAAEIVTFILLGFALYFGRYNALPLSLYWWHPMVLKEFANSVHMDVLLMPFLALAILMLILRRDIWVQIALGLAAAVKFWPLIIMPLAARRNHMAIVYSGAAIFVGALLVMPQLLAVDASAGLTRFGQDWQRNALAFPILESGLGFVTNDAGRWLRLAIAAGFAAYIARYWWQQRADRVYAALSSSAQPVSEHMNRAESIIGHVIMVLIVFWLLLPTGYPWYSLWLLPFSVVKPIGAAILLSLTSAFYYGDFIIQLIDAPGILVWLPAFLSAAPIWVALFMMWRQSKAATYG